MSQRLEGYHRGVISGAEDGAVGSIVRGGLRCIEPFYSGIVSARNALYQIGAFASHSAGRPVISVGNITTGGTGKTPVVQWLASRLRDCGHHPAILLRGYKGGDEKQMLQTGLPGVVVEANPSRVDGAHRVLVGHPNVDVFILDDGFQHRRIKRDLDLVLIDASNPFGFGHVLPRGLLREPMSGLARAGAFLITHTEMVDDITLKGIELTLKRFNPTASLFRCSHVTPDLVRGDNSSLPISEIRGMKVMAFSGIGNPTGFEKQIGAIADLVAAHRFDDHHHYTLPDLSRLADLAARAGAQTLITTEKDWVKLQSLVGATDRLPPVLRARLSIRFSEGDEASLFEQITRAINTQPNATTPSRQDAHT